MSHAAAAGIINVEPTPLRQGPYNWQAGQSDSSDGSPQARPKGVRIDPRVQPPQAREDVESEIGDALSVASGRTEKARRRTKRQRINDLFDDPESSPAAMYTSMWFMFLIILSTVAFMLETLPSLSADAEYGNPSHEDFWFFLETAFVSFFTLEYIVRMATCDHPLQFPFRVFNVIDLLAIAPFYLELGLKASGVGGGGTDLRFVRVVRLARVFRVLKMGKKFDGTTMLLGVFTEAWKALVPPFFFLVLGMVFFSSIMYICEQGTYDKSDGLFYVTDVQGHRVQSSFVSIPEAMWWAIVTMTTVGYGDYYPNTALGRLVNSAAMIFGVMFSAMPIAVIGNAFTQRWQEERMKMNAAKEFRRNEQINNTSNWGPSQLRFFCIAMKDSAWTRMEHYFQPPLPEMDEATDEGAPGQSGLGEPIIDLDDDPDGVEEAERYVSRKLSHELIADRHAIEAELPEEQRNLAYKLYHIIRAESSKCEHNIDTYTLDFASELYHVLGFAHFDQTNGVHLGFRSKAALSVEFGEGKRKKEIKSDSDLGVFTISRRKRSAEKAASYFLSSQCKTTTSQENYGRIAGELLATAQQAYLKSDRKEARRVFLVSFRGFHLTFYSAFFSSEYLETILRGKKPQGEWEIGYYPPRRSMDFPQSTIMGTFDFLTPSHRECAIKILLRIKRILLVYSKEDPGMRRRSTLRGLEQLSASGRLTAGDPRLRRASPVGLPPPAGGGKPGAFDPSRLQGKGDGRMLRSKQ
eukprot:TRINITY_DN3289_c0_g1_i1.p1 TRINITY_DN3289_c0_g1~~TRINITY_DN3289_c0_g1_i1.p1  ORF type:complete len:748 (+),score=206.04 TRINITY_DN3289_c0_g1_i1:63-2306(+)